MRSIGFRVRGLGKRGLFGSAEPCISRVCTTKKEAITLKLWVLLRVHGNSEPKTKTLEGLGCRLRPSRSR